MCLWFVKFHFFLYPPFLGRWIGLYFYSGSDIAQLKTSVIQLENVYTLMTDCVYNSRKFFVPAFTRAKFIDMNADLILKIALQK